MPNPLLYHEPRLLARIAEGDELAFREVYEYYRITVYSFAYTLTRTDIQAEEITQEVFMQIWENRQQVAGMEFFSTWIRTIARNAAYSFFRRKGVEQRALVRMRLDPDEAVDPHQSMERRELEQTIRSAVQALTPQQQAIFRLSREEAKTYSEIADLLQISTHTVKYHISVIYRELRTQFGPIILLLTFLKK